MDAPCILIIYEIKNESKEKKNLYEYLIRSSKVEKNFLDIKNIDFIKFYKLMDGFNGIKFSQKGNYYFSLQHRCKEYI